MCCMYQNVVRNDFLDDSILLVGKSSEFHGIRDSLLVGIASISPYPHRVGIICNDTSGKALLGRIK